MSRTIVDLLRSPLSGDTSDNSTDTDTDIVPYNKWPTECFVCDEALFESERRGQFVVHEGECAEQTAAVPLCQECTTLLAHLLNHHDEVLEYMNTLHEVSES